MKAQDNSKSSSLTPTAPITEDGKEDRLTAETPATSEHSTVRGPMEFPECPWPEAVWPLTVEEVGRILRNVLSLDNQEITAISGALMRQGWNTLKRQLSEQETESSNAPGVSSKESAELERSSTGGEEKEFLGRLHDALTVAFIAGCHCGGKSNPNWRSGHSESCSAVYFGKLIEEVEERQNRSSTPIAPERNTGMEKESLEGLPGDPSEYGDSN